MADTEELPLFRIIRERGGQVPEGPAAELGYIRTYLQTALRQRKHLDDASREVLDNIFLDFALSVGSEHLKKAVSIYLQEAELQEAEEFVEALAPPWSNKE